MPTSTTDRGAAEWHHCLWLRGFNTSCITTHTRGTLDGYFESLGSRVLHSRALARYRLFMKQLLAGVVFVVALAVSYQGSSAYATAEAPTSENLKFCTECGAGPIPGDSVCQSVSIGYHNCGRDMWGECRQGGAECMVWF